MLYAAEGSILENLDSVSGYIKEIRKIDSRLEVMPEEMDSLLVGLEEVAFALRDYMGGLSFDPAELEEIEDRLEYINRLKRKYGGTIEGIFAKKEEVEAELNCIISLDEEIERISRELLEKEKLLTGKARVLSFERVKTAKVLESEIENEMQGMRMSNASFEIVFSEKFEDGEIPVLHSKGADAVEFYISTNIGEEPKPLNRIASGGELSRIVLAIKKVLAGKESVGTVIFDEVDAGIGGAVAEVVGRKLKDVSEHHQVVCITHLPQIACFGDTHFLVSKDISEGKTKTSVSLLGKSERLEEITRMLGGVEVTEKTRQHASEMLKTSK
jgi:DNA repair protein RecN (Recombination protein N)